MAFKLVLFAAVVAVARASHSGVLAPLALNAHNSISTYSTHQQHAPTVHAYAAPALQAYAAPAVHAYAAHAPVVHAYAPVVHAHEPSAPAHYDYGYGVSDPHTGDHHSQQESRRGDAVRGSYSLIEADGSKRTVEYAADDHTGFNAVVHNEPAAVHVKAVAPVAYAAQAPVVHARLAAPAYAAHTVAAPSLVHGYAAHTVAAPSLVNAYAAPSLAHGYAAQAWAAPSLAAHTVVAPAVAQGYSAPLVASHGLSHNVW
ncbi:unnamed protein product [Phaedon cochleariae]|uniref:Cuticle protein n=1 Tax=Phaedon cochleariae TaxID=80249 RepID=A0A9P0DQE2_PHACE|nr:unnamed protein product [Phaedon cochleariae]